MTDNTGILHQTRPGSPPAIRLRVKILGGDLSAIQWRMLARIASEFTPGVPLHLTTRQNIELHDLREPQVPVIQQLLSQVGLTAKQACGNTVRNITVCPCSGVRTGSPDLSPLAWQIRRTLEAIEGDLNLPRKFKISLSACPEACGQPWINDLGLVAVRSGGAWAFRVIVAGSLGSRPALGTVWEERLPVQDVLPVAVAALRVFAVHADRKSRSTARLRHVRQRMGDEAFAATLRQAFQEASAQRDWPRIELTTVASGFDARLPLTFPGGNLSPQEAEALALLAERPDVRLRIDTHHRVILAAREEPVLAHALADLPTLQDASRPQPTIIACPGRRWCKNGLVDTAAMADLIRRELAERLAPGTIVGISGCPSNCAHSAVSPIGLVGGKADGRDIYTLLAGGELGQSDKMAKRIAERLSPESVIKELRNLQGNK